MKKTLLYIIIGLITSFNWLISADVKPPIVTLTTDSCGSYRVRITELSPDDVGVFSAPQLKLSDCFNITPIQLSQNFKQNTPNYDFYFTFSVLSLVDTASLVFLVKDGLGNAETKKIHYSPNLLEIIPGAYNFLGSLINDTAKTIIHLKNDAKPTQIKNVKFRQGKYYSHNSSNEFTLIANEDKSIQVNFVPKVDLLTSIDTLEFFSDCEKLIFSFIVSGYGVKPLIKVEDIDFGFVQVNKYISLAEVKKNDSAISISNPGTSFLNLKNPKLTNGSYFKIIEPQEPKIDGLAIYPKDSIRFKSIGLYSSKLGHLIDTLVFPSNATGIDSISILKAYIVMPGAYISEIDFGKVHLNEVKSDYLIIKNNSTSTLEINNLLVSGDTNDIKIDYNNIFPKLSISNPIKLYPETYDSNLYITKIIVPITFSPKNEKLYKIKVSIKQHSSDTSGIEIFNYVYGEGVLPRLKANGWEFTPEILAGTKFPERGYIKLQNTSTNTETKIYSIEPVYNGTFGENYFSFPEGLPSNLSLKIGEIKDIPVEFFPLTNGNMELGLKITSNTSLFQAPNYSKDTIVNIKGVAYKTPIEIEKTIIGKINKCSNSSINIKFVNPNSEEDILIDSIRFSSSDNNVFYFEDNAITKGFTVKKNNFKEFKVIYAPSLSNNFLHRGFIEYFHDNHTFGFEIFADCYSPNVIVNFDTLYNVKPGILYNSPSNLMNIFKISLKDSAFDGMLFNNFKLILQYNPGQIDFKEKIHLSQNLSDWLISTKKINSTAIQSYYEITGISQTPISELKGFLMPEFETILIDTNEIHIKMDSIYVNDNSNCLSFTSNIGKLYLNQCVLQMGELILSKYNFSSMNITPNPVSSDEITIKFSVAFRNMTTIQFFNTDGILIYTPLEKFLEAGDYEMNFSVKDVPAGCYTVKFKSGFFSDSQQLIVIK